MKKPDTPKILNRNLNSNNYVIRRRNTTIVFATKLVSIMIWFMKCQKMPSPSQPNLRSQKWSKNQRWLQSSSSPSTKWTRQRCAWIGASGAWSVRRLLQSSQTWRTMSVLISELSLSPVASVSKNFHNKAIVIDTKKGVSARLGVFKPSETESFWSSHICTAQKRIIYLIIVG